MIGRSLYHADLVRQGRRRFWSWTPAWELMIAIGMGVVAGGAAEYLQLTGMAAAGFIAAIDPSRATASPVVPALIGSGSPYRRYYYRPRVRASLPTASRMPCISAANSP